MSSEAPAGQRTCPRCRFTLSRVVLRDRIEVDHCHHCRGSFLDPGEETELLGPMASPGVWQDSELTQAQGPSSLLSPVTGQPMQAYRIFFSKAVEVDRCEQTGGLWLDDKEADALREILDLAAQTDQSTFAEQRPSLGAGTYVLQLLTGFPVEVWNPRQRVPRATFSIIVACILVYVFELWAMAQGGSTEQLVEALALQPGLLRGHAVWGCVTYAFLHVGLMHLVGNMYMLYVFGDNVEDKLGGRRFLGVYGVSALSGALVQVALQGPDSPMVMGASGAVAGVMTAYWLLFPRVRIRSVIFGLPIYLTMTVYLGIWIAMNVGMMASGGGGVAWLCHLGGAAGGLAMAWPHRRKDFAALLEEQRGASVQQA